MKIYDEREFAGRNKIRHQRASAAVQRQKGTGECDVDRDGEGVAESKGSGVGFNPERISGTDSEISAAQDDRGANLGGVAQQFEKDCLERLAENKAQIKAHQSAIASLEKSNKLLIEQMARIQELKDKLNQSED